MSKMPTIGTYRIPYVNHDNDKRFTTTKAKNKKHARAIVQARCDGGLLDYLRITGQPVKVA